MPDKTGDISNAQIFMGGFDFQPFPAVTSFAQEDAEYNEVQKKRAEATSEQFVKSMLDNAGKDNMVANAASWVAEKIYTDFEPEEGFSISDEETLQILQDNQLNIKYAQTIKDSKSSGELTYRLGRARHEMQIDKEINETLSNRARITSAAVGTLVDADILTGMFVGSMMSKSASLAKVIVGEGAAEAALSTAHYLFDDDYTIEDGIIDATIGTSIAAGATTWFRRGSKNGNIDPYDRDAVGGKLDSVNGSSKNVETEFHTPRPDYNAQEELYNVRKAFFERNEVKFKETGQDAMIAPSRYRYDLDGKIQSEYAHEKYTRVKANRDAFFGRQKEVVEEAATKPPSRERLHQEKIKTIEAQIAKERKALEAADTDRKKKIRQNRIDKLRGELATTKQELDDFKFGTINGKTPEQVRFNNMVDELMLDMKLTFDGIEEQIKNNNLEWMKRNQDVVEELATRYPDEMTDLRNLMRSKLGNAEDFVKKELKIGNMKLNKKQKAAVAAVILGTTGAQAGEDDGYGGMMVAVGLSVLATVLFGSRAVDIIKNPTTKEALSNTYNKTKRWMAKADYNNSPDGENLRRRRDDIADSIKTRLTSTVAPFERAGGKINDVVQKLLFSAKSGSGAEITKRRRIEAALGRYLQSEKYYIKAFKKESGAGITPNIYSDLNHETNFRHLVADYIEGVKIDGDYPRSVKEFAETVRKEMEEMYKYNVDMKTFGFVPYKKADGTMSKAIEYKSNMLPRLWRDDTHSWFKRLGEEDRAKVTNALYLAIKARLPNQSEAALKGAQKTAEKFAERWYFGRRMGNTTEDAKGSMFETISHLLKDDTEFDEYLDALNVSKDKSARAKHRINMDMDVFDNELAKIKVNVDGVEKTLKKSDFVDRNIRSIFDKTSHNLYTSGALSSEGFKSVKQLERSIELAGREVTDPQLMKDMDDIKKLILGIPNDNENALIKEFSLVAKDITLMTKLPFSAFSTTQEIGNLIGNHGIGKSLKKFVEYMTTSFGKDSFMMRQLTDVYGVGTQVRRTDITFFGITDDLLALEDGGVRNAIRNGTMKMRNMVLLPLGAMTDMIQRINSALDLEDFAKVINGQEVKNRRWSTVNVNEEIREMFGNTFEFNAQGKLKDFDISKWSQKKRDALGNILFEMEQHTTITNTIGETPLFTKTDSAGRIMGTLLGYSLGQFNTHTVEGVRNLDRTASMQLMAGFMGSYIGLHARYAFQGKEVDEQDIIAYSLMNTPVMTPAALIQGGASPVVFDTITELGKVPMNIIGATDYGN